MKNGTAVLVLFSALIFSFGCGGSGSSGGVITPPPATLSIAPSSASVVLGGTATFTLSAFAQCNDGGLGGKFSLNGNQLAYTAPVAVPSSWTGSISCTTQDGSATAKAKISLTYPVPRISSISTPAIYLGRESIVPGIRIKGSGFYPGGVLHNSLFGDLTLIAGTDPHELILYLGFDTPHYSPGWITLSVSSSPSGPGGGTSNSMRFAFLGNQNTLAFASGFAYSLDQADQMVNNQSGTPGSGTMHKFDLSTGAFVKTMRLNDFLNYGIAYDDATGYTLVSDSARVTMIWKDDALYNAILDGPPGGTGKLPLAVSAKGGQACISENGDIQRVIVSDLGFAAGTAPSVTPITLGTSPWSVQMARMGSALYCLVYDSEDTTFSIISAPDAKLLHSVKLADLMPASKVPLPLGGWQLAAFDSGPAAGIAALLSQADSTIVFVDLDTGAEVRRVKLPSSDIPFRIAADEVHGRLIVAEADPAAGLTRFTSVDSLTGAVAPLQSTTDILAVGFAVSADGAHLYAAMRDQFRIIPNE